ncbi:MAG: DUF2070 family protein [Nitrososphaerales archaeon]
MNATSNLQRRYKLLFRLPSTRASATISSLVAALLAFLVSIKLSLGFESIYLVAFSVLVLLVSFLLERALLAVFPLATVRRLMAISYVANGCWLGLSMLGLVLSFWLPNAFTSFLILGFFVSVAFRILIIVAAVCGGAFTGVIAAVLQPLLLFLLIASYTPPIFYSNSASFLIGFLFAASVGAYLFFVDRATGNSSMRSLKILRAFLEAWAADKPDLLERIIEERSEETQIKTYLLSFNNSHVNIAIVVSDVHPGPFANVGSSNIPYEMQKWLSDRYAPLILHSFSSHDLNLPSKRNVNLLLKSLDKFETLSSSNVCTEFLTTSYGKATVNGIAFNKTALLTITLAPEGMEDFPPQVGNRIKDAASELGFQELIVVDAHNSQGESNSDDELNDIVEASRRLLQKLSVSPKYPFKVGFSHSSEFDFKFKQDVGAGGIGVLLLEVGGKKFLLVSVDANNAVKGLRDKVVNGLGLDDVNVVEICTSDTHFASGKARTPLGYSPLGELTEIKEIMDVIRTLAKKANERLAEATVATKVTHAQVKVMGSNILNEFSKIFDKAFKATKNGGKILLIELLAIVIIVSLI